MRIETKRQNVIAGLCVASAICGAPALAQQTPPTAGASAPTRARETFDPATGRNLLNYPPHRQADISHIRLEIGIADMNTPRMSVRQTIALAPIAGELKELDLHGDGLKISGMSCVGRGVTYDNAANEQLVRVLFDPPIPEGQNASLVAEFVVEDPPEGVLWTPESPAWPGRSASLHTQGEAESNRYWFLSHDFPNDRMTSEVIVSVPAGYTAISNGELIRSDSVSVVGGPGVARFHYRQDRAHPSYLISLVVGKFDVVDVGSRELPMPVYVTPGRGDWVRATFERTPRMVRVFERISGEPYPWAKYAQVCVPNFFWGGMENTSCTTLFEDAVLDRKAMLDGDQDELISHELAHQWFGNLLTCRSWEHIWLNEGFATYLEHLWAEFKNMDSAGTLDGSRGDRAAYLAGIWGEFQKVFKDDQADAPYQPAMVSKAYAHPDDVINRKSNPYPKGASVLHMLRVKLGDEVFFRGLRRYVALNKDRAVETYHFRRAMEEASGESLQRLFDQWCLRPGVPRVTLTQAWDAESKTLTIEARQTQTINGDNPAFALDLPVWIRVAGESDFRRERLRFDERAGALTLALGAEPTMIIVDPELTELAQIRFEQPTARWVAQLNGGPNVGAKLQAAEHLERARDLDAGPVIAALSQAAKSEREPTELRTRAIEALGHLGGISSATDDHPEHPCSVAALEALLALAPSPGSGDAVIRRSIVEQLPKAALCGSPEQRKKIAARLEKYFREDPSAMVRGAAVVSLVTLQAEGSIDMVREALGGNSHADAIRLAALGVLAELDSPMALSLAVRYAGPGYAPKTRGEAAKAVGKLSHHDTPTAFGLLSVLAESREVATAEAAIDALGDVDDPRVRAFLDERSRNAAGRTRRHWFKRTLAELGSHPAPAAQAPIGGGGQP